jgi:RimJ/RimL family protein N-acetyltransferase
MPPGLAASFFRGPSGIRRSHRVFATCDPRNVASAAVLRNLGLEHDGRLRHTLLLRDGWRDSDVYSILEPEWAGAPG